MSARDVGSLQPADAGAARVAAELSAGLLAPEAMLHPKYLYDKLGSHLFEAITELAEYYPTRTEAGIFAANQAAFATQIGLGATLIDLGAGNCQKAASLFAALQPAHYVAVDISADFLHQALGALQRQHPDIAMQALALDFSDRLRMPAGSAPGKRVFFYPGSSIGNFSPADALHFLRDVRQACGAQGGLLIGVDLLKPAAVLEPAYDDALGVTAAFNLNMLLHVNRLIGSNFTVSDWQHVGIFNAALARIEMHVQARRDLTLVWPGHSRHFAAGERIHTESSYKYEPQVFAQLLQDAGFAAPTLWTDPQSGFGVFYAPV